MKYPVQAELPTRFIVFCVSVPNAAPSILGGVLQLQQGATFETASLVFSFQSRHPGIDD